MRSFKENAGKGNIIVLHHQPQMLILNDFTVACIGHISGDKYRSHVFWAERFHLPYDIKKRLADVSKA